MSVSSEQLELNRRLIAAAKAGDLKSVKECFANKEKAEVEFFEHNNDGAQLSGTALIFAVRAGSLDVVQYLIKEMPAPRARIGVQTIRRSGLLHLAAANSHLELFKWLVNNTDLNIQLLDLDSQTPLDIAAARGCTQIVKYIVEQISAGNMRGFSQDLLYSNQPKPTPLHFAAESGNVETLEYLIQTCPKMLADCSNDLQVTPLNSVFHYDRLYYENGVALASARVKHLQKAIMLYKANPDSLKKFNVRGESVLFLAAKFGDFESFEYLFKICLKDEPQLLKATSYEGTLAHAAAMHCTGVNAPGILELIIANDPNSLHVRNTDGNTPLIEAGRCSNHIAVKTILSKYPELYDQTDKDGFSVLHRASYSAQLVLGRYPEGHTSCRSVFATLDFFLNNLQLFPHALNKTVKFSNNNEVNVVQDLANFVNNRRATTMEARTVFNYFFSKGIYIELLSINTLDFTKVGERFKKLFDVLPQTAILQASDRELIQHLGAGVNARSRERQGNTALHLAIMNDRKELACRLLEAGANPDLVNDLEEPMTPTMLAAKKLDPYFLRLIHFYQTKRIFDRYQAELQTAKPDSKAEDEKKKTEVLESLLRELHRSSIQAFDIIKHLKEIPQELQAEILIYLANALTPLDNHGFLRPVAHPVQAYETLRQVLKYITKDHAFYKEAHKRMHDLLAKDLVLKPNPVGPEPIPCLRSDALSAEIKQGKERQVSSLEDDDETEGDEIEKLTSVYKLKHLCSAQPDSPEIKNYMVEYVYGITEGIVQTRKGEEIQQALLKAGIQDNFEAVILHLNTLRDLHKKEREFHNMQLENKQLREKLKLFEQAFSQGTTASSLAITPLFDSQAALPGTVSGTKTAKKQTVRNGQ